MHSFHYKNNELYCEGVSVRSIAQKVGTPFYLYSHETLVDHFRKIKKAFAPVNPLICFAMKANGNMAVIRTLVNEGAGVDIVSGGELYKALKAGANAKKICYASVGKTEKEITEAIRRSILFFNVESQAELAEINRISGKLHKKTQVALRLNPDVDAVTHKAITTGTLKNKFGIDLKTARTIFLNQRKCPNLKLNGIHIHIGSQITNVAPYVKAIKKVAAFKTALEKQGVHLEYLNFGGGMGADYISGSAKTAHEVAKNLIPLLKKINLKIIMEPGRFIVANAGIFVTKVLYNKDNGVKKFLIVDGGMNDLIRPSLYDAYHEIVPVRKTSGKTETVDIVGPICESGDFLGKGRKLPKLLPGNLIAIMTAGAYGYAMSSNYNARCRVAEVMVKGSKLAVVNARQTLSDLTRGEQIPGFLK